MIKPIIITRTVGESWGRYDTHWAVWSGKRPEHWNRHGVDRNARFLRVWVRKPPVRVLRIMDAVNPVHAFYWVKRWAWLDRISQAQEAAYFRGFRDGVGSDLDGLTPEERAALKDY